MKHTLPLELKKLILLGLFILALVASNVLGAKVTTLFGIGVSVAIFTYPVTFAITDIVEEVFGKKYTYYFVYVGVIVLICLFAITALSLQLPANARFAEKATAYTTTFSNSLRIMIASLAAFLLAQTHDIWAFNWWKNVTKGRYLWLRSKASTILSQGIDTFVFMYLAFYHLTPRFSAGFVLQLSITYWAFKTVFALMDTPLVYLGVWWLRGRTTVIPAEGAKITHAKPVVLP